MSLLKPCLECGELTETPRCEEHTPKPVSRPKAVSTTERGYGWRWQKLSEKARRMSPFCETCGATEDLTTDHTPEAWKRHNEGKAIRLQDVSVLCRSCNSRKGRARPE